MLGGRSRVGGKGRFSLSPRLLPWGGRRRGARRPTRTHPLLYQPFTRPRCLQTATPSTLTPSPAAVPLYSIRHRLRNLFFHRTASAEGPIKRQLTKQLKACFNTASSRRTCLYHSVSPSDHKFHPLQDKVPIQQNSEALGGQLYWL